MKSVNFYDVEITDGFWKNKQKLVAETTVYAVYNRFKETGRISTMNCKWKEGDENRPHFFWGSDVFKWIEGVAYILEKKKDDELLKAVNSVIDDVESAMDSDGYYNSYFNTFTDLPRFDNRNMHELYSAGHMIEAGVAWAHATNDKRLLNLCIRNADCIYKVFITDKSASFKTPGHEEIELALIKLYNAVGDKKYLELADYFLRERGNNDNFTDKQSVENRSSEFQSHLPVLQQTEAAGHAVRAVYLYSGMADLGKAENDSEFICASQKLFDNIYEKQMYITGGIGAQNETEAFSGNYLLPNASAYAETCASIGLALFARRLYNTVPDARYGDAAEVAIYNGALSGLSLSGDAFFYENPLEINVARKIAPKIHHPALTRKKVFECSCCPPNLTRFIPSIGDFIYGYDESTLFVHQYIPNNASFDNRSAKIVTDYPVDGNIHIECEGFKRIAVRKPLRCTVKSVSEKYTEQNGYMYFDAASVDLVFDLTPKYFYSTNKVTDTVGKAAVVRGPIVYCAEDIDQNGCVFSERYDTEKPITVLNETFGGFPLLIAEGDISEDIDALYSSEKPIRNACKIKLIPFSTFANRGESNMRVWLNIK